MTYNLRTGYSVRATKVAAGTEFETRNVKGETISTVILGFAQARALVIKLTKGA